MRVESKDERIARGAPVGGINVYQGMGGLTGLTSLLDAPTRATVVKTIAYSEDLPHDSTGGRLGTSENANGPPVRRKMTEQEEMAYYEARYQERLKAERQQGLGQSRPKKNYAISLNGPPNSLTLPAMKSAIKASPEKPPRSAGHTITSTTANSSSITNSKIGRGGKR